MRVGPSSGVLAGRRRAAGDLLGRGRPRHPRRPRQVARCRAGEDAAHPGLHRRRGCGPGRRVPGDTLDVGRVAPAHGSVVAWDGPRPPWLPAVSPSSPSAAAASASASTGRSRTCPPRGDGPSDPARRHGHPPAHAATCCAVVGRGGRPARPSPTDGGYWAVGLRRYLPARSDGVPMSTDAPGRPSSPGCAPSALRPAPPDVPMSTGRPTPQRPTLAPHTRFARPTAASSPRRATRRRSGTPPCPRWGVVPAVARVAGSAALTSSTWRPRCRRRRPSRRRPVRRPGASTSGAGQVGSSPPW